MGFMRPVAILRLHRGFSIAERKARRETDEIFETLFPPLRSGPESDKKSDQSKGTDFCLPLITVFPAPGHDRP